MQKARSWGILPEVLIKRLWQREWQNRGRLKSRLLDSGFTPIEVGLKPPTEQIILQDIPAFQAFVEAWRKWDGKIEVIWKTFHYPRIGKQSIPIKIRISSLLALATFLGEEALQLWEDWRTTIERFLYGLTPGDQTPSFTLFSAIVNSIEALTALSPLDQERMLTLLPQLSYRMGKGCYLRALNVTGIDTKFIENNGTLVAALLAGIYPSAPLDRECETEISGTVIEDITNIGLYRWLDVKQTPKDWLLVRLLCPQLQLQYQGLELLRLPAAVLMTHSFEVENILIIENEQSAFSLPEWPNLLVIAGTGKNLNWLSAPWLQGKRIAYWGDIDLDGLSMLSQARALFPEISPLMMNVSTLTQYRDYMVQGSQQLIYDPPFLTAEEGALFQQLRTHYYGASRLEQERISQDEVIATIHDWMNERAK
ncbi:hypothetical protein DC083_09120 [Ignatzschineria ureiclastica]|uniref:DUF3322 and DUF2220 domain-containing protein n=1 Tax=Ignatzschineria ureiclastica TaxID=472582 RepID=A0A2U2ACS8_9GAMM|nr:DUF3322 and DUF2220 domain-containing protein [Ignatzschineria ureiclastica]PWD80461.1 hypothetical protein DC083_09120 [Ignatzschineria ureiclastica]GGZ99323.1 hypothetical protein GCM10007162_14300 [Ignatzschineria ureiclastica]